MMKPFTPAPVKPVVSAEALKAFDIRVGRISSVADVPNSDRLVRLTVDFGDHSRRIVAGIKASTSGMPMGSASVLAVPDREVPNGAQAG